jgi:hypothetical protein
MSRTSRIGLILGIAVAQIGCAAGQFGDTGSPTGNGSPSGTGGRAATGTGGGAGGSSPNGTGGASSSGSGGGSPDGTGGTDPGTGGSATGSGGSDGTDAGTGGSPSGSGGTTPGTGGTTPGTGGTTPGTGGGGPGGGVGGAAGLPDPFSVAPTCTSKKTWTGGNEGSASMNPGKACISCHKSSGGEAPAYAIAGTIYPTAHEPDLCNGANGSDGAQIVIVGADGKTVTLTPNSVGNFYSSTTVKLPYQAKVVYMGREQVMAETQTSGDCNSCHTQNGANNAPGRILLP